MSKKTVSMCRHGTKAGRVATLTSFSRKASMLFLGLFALPVQTDTTDDMERWLEAPATGEGGEVNEGRLQFLTDVPDGPLHHHQNMLTISQTTLQDGWIRLEQCHDHLDPVGRAEIIFRKGHVRNLALQDQVGIGNAWIADDSVQLADIARPSRLCLSAETKAVQGDGAGGYVLRNGPYMRRFLDGYYPMRVTLQVNYPCGSLKVSAIHPRPQPGFRVTHDACTLGINALFEGRLRTEIRFQSPPAPDQPSKVNP